jgi:hypothetical protein
MTLLVFPLHLAQADGEPAQAVEPAQTAGDASPSFAFTEGDVITHDQVEKLKTALPPEIWDNRSFIFYKGMEMKIGPAYRDYSPAQAYKDATVQFKGESKLGPEGNLDGYTAGQPFPMEDIDCSGDPSAGLKIMWDFDYQWDGDGTEASFLYSYWDRGERLPLYYEGVSKILKLSNRVEPYFLESGGNILKKEKRKYAFRIRVDAPFDSRGILVMTYRYKNSDGLMADATNDDTWVYVPSLRRVRRISTAQRTDAVSGTDFTLDDMYSFGGIVAQYNWECLGEMDILAPSNTTSKGYPFEKDQNFGPYGLSFANDNWEMRHAIKVRFTSKLPDHPYSRKDIYVDKETAKALYSFAYDQKGDLWKIIYHNARWSEDDASYYLGWPGIEQPRDLRNISDVIVNVQTGTGNRIEFWDSHGTPYLDKEGKVSKSQIRKTASVGDIQRMGR